MKGVLTFEEWLEGARDELCTEQQKNIDTERRLYFWMSHEKELEAI